MKEGLEDLRNDDLWWKCAGETARESVWHSPALKLTEVKHGKIICRVVLLQIPRRCLKTQRHPSPPSPRNRPPKPPRRPRQRLQRLQPLRHQAPARRRLRRLRCLKPPLWPRRWQLCQDHRLQLLSMDPILYLAAFLHCILDVWKWWCTSSLIRIRSDN